MKHLESAIESADFAELILERIVELAIDRKGSVVRFL
jgi:hypothetical protein